MPYIPVVLIVIGILILAVAIYLAIVIIKARRRQAQSLRQVPDDEQMSKDQEVTEGKKVRAAISYRTLSSNLDRSFREAVKILKATGGGWRYRYKIPWLMMIGEPETGKSTLLNSLGLNLIVGRPEMRDDEKSPCDWYFFDQGVVLDINGGTVFHPEATSSRDNNRIWQKLLRLLQKTRPERPVDGIILTLPATELMAPAEVIREHLRARAEIVHKKLSETQTFLGMKVPVYVIITKCDAITGFQSYCNALPAHYKHQMLGWSSPYSLDNSFAPRWVEEAFESVTGTLTEAQIELFTLNKEIDSADDLFLFMSEFGRLRMPLQEYINEIFRQNVYHEALLFRGLYFTGDPGQEVLGDEKLLPDPRPVFMQDLFEKKIFAEFNIARPITRIALSRNRGVIAAQIALIIILVGWSSGLYMGYDALMRKKEIVLEFLKVLAHEADTSPDSNGGGASGDKSSFNEQVVNAFVQYASLQDDSRLNSFFVPSSWLWPARTANFILPDAVVDIRTLHDDITDCMVEKYDRFVLRMLYQGLNKKATKITEPVTLHRSYGYFVPPDSASMALNPVERAEHYEEFQRLRKFMDDLDAFEQHMKFYENLCTEGKGGLEELTKLLKFLYNLELIPNNENRAYYFQQAVNKADAVPFDPQPYKQAALEKVRVLIKNFSDRVFYKNTLLMHSQHLYDLTRRLMNFSQSAGAINQNGLIARDLRDKIVYFEADLGRPELSWITSDTLSFGGIYKRTMGMLGRSGFLEPGTRQEMEDLIYDDFQQLKSKMSEQKTAYGAPILENKEGKLFLSSDIKQLKQALETLLVQEFMISEQPEADQLSGLNNRFMWNVSAIDDISRRVDNASQFISKTVETFPAVLRQPLKAIAIVQIQTDAQNRILLAREPNDVSASVTDEDNMRREVQNFGDASPALAKLLSTFQQRQMSDARRTLLGLVSGQISSMLGRLSLQFNARGLYTIDEYKISAWDGRRPLSLAMFGNKQETDMSDYVALQQRAVRALAGELSRPLITFIRSTPDLQSALDNTYDYRLWFGVLKDLDAYLNKEPGNVLLQFENFMLNDLDSINVDNYTEKLTRRTPRPGDSYLATQFANLKNRIYATCQTLVERESVQSYQAIERYFNEYLAGRFPFTDTSAAVLIDEADPDYVRYFFRLFDKFNRSGKKVITESRVFEDGSREEIKKFFLKLESVRSFLNGFLYNENKYQIPAYDMDIDFRVNRKEEMDGNQIVEWNLISGSQRVNNRDLDRKARWAYGMPLKIAMRWAKDAPYMPMKPAIDKLGLRIEDKTAIVEFNNRWSLISLMREYASTVSQNGVSLEDDPGNNLLMFAIPTLQPGADGRMVNGQAKVFMRINLLSPEKKSSIILPVFPIRAPRLLFQKEAAQR
jgi:type VI secretion system protein ImpL